MRRNSRRSRTRAADDRRGLAHERLSPANCDDLLFDDVLWVQNARRDHFDFIDKMRDRALVDDTRGWRARPPASPNT